MNSWGSKICYIMDAKWHDGDLGNRRGRSSLGQVGWTWRRFWFVNKKVRSVERLHTGCARRSCDKKVAKRSVYPCIVEFNDQIASAGLIACWRLKGWRRLLFPWLTNRKDPDFFLVADLSRDVVLGMPFLSLQTPTSISHSESFLGEATLPPMP